MSQSHRTLTRPDKIPWLSLTFWGDFSLTFPDLRTVVYIQMKQFEDNVSSSTSTKTFWLMLKIRSERGGKLNFGYIWKCAERSEVEKISAVDTFSLTRKVWKLYNVWPGSEQNSMTFPDHSEGTKNIIPWFSLNLKKQVKFHDFPWLIRKIKFSLTFPDFSWWGEPWGSVYAFLAIFFFFFFWGGGIWNSHT